MYDRMFFGTRHDIVSIVNALNGAGISYAMQLGTFNLDEPPMACHITSLPCLNPNASLRELLQPYLIMERSIFAVDRIPQRRGADRLSVDLSNNPSAWYFVAGGEASPKVLVPGRIYGDLNGDGSCLARAFDLITKEYRGEGPFLVSPTAQGLALAGARLVANGNPSAPKTYDLRIP